MILGVDLDNTIVRCEEVFHAVALERGWIPATLPARKNAVRDYLRAQGREREWTELQGSVYGPRLAGAPPFPGALEFFAHAVRRRLPVWIISHKTRTALVGPPHDLQQSAREWLAAHGFFDPRRIGLSPDHVCFAETRAEKLRLIREKGCTHFVDDLEETFREPAFPGHVVAILFGHHSAPRDLPQVKPLADWAQVFEYVFHSAA